MRRLLILLSIAVIASPASAGYIEDAKAALDAIRPGSQYVIAGPECRDLIWQDKAQAAPSCSELATAIAAVQSAQASRRAALNADAARTSLVARLKSATPAQIDAWVAANVTTLAQAREAIAAILKIMALETRQ